ncbi:hypothetical protein GBA52_021163 [Prunus armeniaca]|nr:hypothetical protein GBA52_021163 [Prunus armeniaca]
MIGGSGSGDDDYGGGGGGSGDSGSMVVVVVLVVDVEVLEEEVVVVVMVVVEEVVVVVVVNVVVQVVELDVEVFAQRGRPFRTSIVGLVGGNNERSSFIVDLRLGQHAANPTTPVSLHSKISILYRPLQIQTLRRPAFNHRCEIDAEN